MNPSALRLATIPVSITLVLLLQFSAAAQVVNLPPTPEWIQSDDARTNRPMFLHKSFVAPPRMLKAILLGACDGNMTVFINGHEAAEISGRERATSVDITQLLNPGTNGIAVRAIHPGGLPIASLLIEVNGDLTERKWIASDSTWLGSTLEQPGWNTSRFDPRGWASAKSIRRVDAAGAANPFDVNKAFDAYNSWKLALEGNVATDPASFTLLPGFQAERVRSALPEEGSWVAMAFDPQGRLTLAREQRGLLRLNVAPGKTPDVEVINDTLLECRGLLYAHGALYANANNSKALFRLRDTDGDGRFDETVELLRTGGGVGHGRNHVKLGPDGWIYIAHGNNVLLPTNAASESPLKHYADDQLIPCPWDRGMFDGDVELPAGHVLRFNPDEHPIKPEVFAGGFRNELDVAFNRDGEMFTFDADMEWDVGAPWYVPNRVLHVVSGGDYGWRRGTGRYPPYYADTLPSAVDIGLASPTGVTFGYGTRFPAKYQEALYILDWAYGRILAVHLTPHGASYKATSELFVTGRPLNVTDACVGPDGALWFITGGRRTQSGLYRITYSGAGSSGAPITDRSNPVYRRANDARALRRKLESFHRGVERTKQTDALKVIWPQLGDSDRWVRHAAQIALENVEPALWKDRALRESNPDRALTALLALTRLGGTQDSASIIDRLNRLVASPMNEEQLLIALRLYEVAIARLGIVDDKAGAGLARLEGLYTRFVSSSEDVNHESFWEVNHELCKLLVHLKSPLVIPKTLALLRTSNRSEDLLHYLFYLRTVKEGWSIDQRRQYFEALARADSLLGARQYVKALQDIRREVVASLNVAEREALKPLLPGPNEPPAALTMSGPIVKEWKLEDLLPRLDEVSRGRSFAGGKAAAVSAQCVVCHRVSADASLPAGLVGPDLTSVSSRFNRRDLLDHILNPSKVIDEKFRNLTFTLSDGTELSGTVESEDDKNVVIRLSPLAGQPTVVSRGTIRKREPSSVSPMPEGLLNTLQAEQILDLLAFFEASGNPNAAMFKPRIESKGR